MNTPNHSALLQRCPSEACRVSLKGPAGLPKTDIHLGEDHPGITAEQATQRKYWVGPASTQNPLATFFVAQLPFSWKYVPGLVIREF